MLVCTLRTPAQDQSQHWYLLITKKEAGRSQMPACSVVTKSVCVRAHAQCNSIEQCESLEFARQHRGISNASER